MLQLTPKPRRFLPADFKVGTWDDLAPYAQKLLERDIATRDAFDQFLRDESEFGAVVNEEEMWRYVRNSRYTNDEAAKSCYDDYVATILPQLAEWGNAINQKILASPFIEQPQDEAERLLFRRLKQEAAMFRSENVPLQTDLMQLVSKTNEVRGAMSVTLDGEIMTIPQANQRLFWPDRSKREEAWRAINGRRLQDKETFDDIFDQMVKKRHQIALNAGYKNFRDYQHDAYQRFDYAPEDCYKFHEAVEKHIMPILSKMNQKRAGQMGLDVLKPWDLACDPLGRPALKAFDGADDMVDKGITVLDAIDPMFGDVVRAQRAMDRLDLASRPHKRPGAYNAGMNETFVAFMFANATSTVDDVSTFIHEAGHATHDILKSQLPLGAYKAVGMEIAEVASMTMELFAFDKWPVFFSDTVECKRAQEEFISFILVMFPWMAQIDAIQHEFYLKPDMTAEERHDAWYAIVERFSANGMDRSDFAAEYRTQWHKQGHVFEDPFYYIEYAIAQLGALQLWRNYLADPAKTVEQYKAALALGATKSLPELYETAGIKFDFSPAMLAELTPFLMEQLAKFES